MAAARPGRRRAWFLAAALLAGPGPAAAARPAVRRLAGGRPAGRGRRAALKLLAGDSWRRPSQRARDAAVPGRFAANHTVAGSLLEELHADGLSHKHQATTSTKAGAAAASTFGYHDKGLGGCVQAIAKIFQSFATEPFANIKKRYYEDFKGPSLSCPADEGFRAWLRRDHAWEEVPIPEDVFGVGPGDRQGKIDRVEKTMEVLRLYMAQARKAGAAVAEQQERLDSLSHRITGELEQCDKLHSGGSESEYYACLASVPKRFEDWKTFWDSAMDWLENAGGNLMLMPVDYRNHVDKFNAVDLALQAKFHDFRQRHAFARGQSQVDALVAPFQRFNARVDEVDGLERKVADTVGPYTDSLREQDTLLANIEHQRYGVLGKLGNFLHEQENKRLSYFDVPASGAGAGGAGGAGGGAGAPP